jgi:hypothetical protein
VSRCSQHPPPILLLYGQVNLTDLDIPGAPYQYSNLALFTGAYNDVPEDAVHSELELGGQTGVLSVTSNGTLFFARLVRGTRVVEACSMTIERKFGSPQVA